jgi:predicted exporter
MVAVGLIVDYNIHLAFAFVSQKEGPRLEPALGHVLFAIVCSCVTTVGACVTLFFAEMVPFTQFGVIVTLSVVLSLVLVCSLFAPLLFAVGDALLGFEAQISSWMRCGWCKEKIPVAQIVEVERDSSRREHAQVVEPPVQVVALV